ncbi:MULTISPECIES: hypothetical protein [Pseudomonas]|uniref:hypothetical protein n=1 Tax=Pseudomonas TaxID=286 RepID=UPI00235F2C74|nr:MULTISPECIES: hypothetical protein [Pseudomonas]WJV23204.1 hypothetical protein PSR66_26800 [Pseudomonas chlororaphis]
MHNRHKRNPPNDPDSLLINSLIEEGKIILEAPNTFRISKFEVIVERSEYLYQILSIPRQLRENPDLPLVLDYFTTKYHWYENPSRTTRVRARGTAKYFLDFLEENYENLLSLPQAILRFLSHLKNNKSPGATRHDAVILRKIFYRAIEEKYPEASKRPKSVSEIIQATNQIQVKSENRKKNPALGRYLGISHKKYTNNQLLNGIRLGAMWLLNKISDYRQRIISLPEVKDAISRCSGLSEIEIEKLYPNYAYTMAAEGRRLTDPAYAQWCLIQSDPLLTEWHFYNDKKFRRHSLDYGDEESVHLFTEPARDLFIGRYLDHKHKIVRVSAKGLGQKDIAWRVLRPVYHAARLAKRPSTHLWGINWIRHTPIEKLLFVWLLSTERIQSSGIKSMKIPCLEFDEQEKPKTLQLISLKLRKGHSGGIKRAVVRSQIYKKHHPPFHTYSEWRKTCILAKETIANFNKEGFLIANSSAALQGNLSTDMRLETYVLFRILITQGTLWQETFLSENDDHLNEARAFIEILRNRILAPDAQKIPRLPPDPISQSLVLEKELETNQTELHSEINSRAMGHSVATGRHIYKDGFMAAEVSEIVEPVDAFIRRVGDERFKTALALSSQLAQSSHKISLSELKEISGIDDSALTIEKLIDTLTEKDRLLITGELLHDSQKIIIETDFTAAIMASYIEHLEESLASIITTERTDTCTTLLGELIYLTQTLRSFPAEIKAAGETLRKSLDLKFPPVI